MSTHEKHTMQDPRLPFIFHRFSSKPGQTSGGNWHENVELLCITEGSATVITDEQTLSVSAGDIAVVNANCIHEIRTVAPMRYYCLIVDRDFCLANGFDSNTVHFTSLIKDPSLFALISAFADEHANADAPFRILALRSLLLRIVTELCKHYGEEGKKTHEETRLLSSVKAVIGYIHSESYRPLTLDELANVAGMSKCYLSRTFHRITGHTVTSYVNHTRCEKAKALLSEGKTVESIAHSCGFANVSYFIRTFSALNGTSPGEYREQLRSRDKDAE